LSKEKDPDAMGISILKFLGWYEKGKNGAKQIDKVRYELLG